MRKIYYFREILNKMSLKRGGRRSVAPPPSVRLCQSIYPSYYLSIILTHLALISSKSALTWKQSWGMLLLACLTTGALAWSTGTAVAWLTGTLAGTTGLAGLICPTLLTGNPAVELPVRILPAWLSGKLLAAWLTDSLRARLTDVDDALGRPTSSSV